MKTLLVATILAFTGLIALACNNDEGCGSGGWGEIEVICSDEYYTLSCYVTIDDGDEEFIHDGDSELFPAEAGTHRVESLRYTQPHLEEVAYVDVCSGETSTVTFE